MSEFKKHLLQRGLEPHLNILAWISWEVEHVYFPLWCPADGLLAPYKLIGYQRYVWHEDKLRDNGGRYWTWITPPYKHKTIWGLSQLNNLDESDKPVLVTEGIWDAIRCIQCGYDAVAIMTATPSKEFSDWFKLVMQEKRCIGVLDNDENSTGLKLRRLLPECIVCEDYKDIGEYPYKEAKEWLTKKLKQY